MITDDTINPIGVESDDAPITPAEGVTPQCVGCDGCSSGCCKEAPRGHLNCYDWLGDIPGGFADSDMVEVQFKNTRKGFYRNAA
ncbi:MAG: hypothetical protein J6U03_01875, partial [Muribaculaceae bacterium]|nr:hypothetical protein [Muribaculaceae bacterium]